MRSCAKTGCSEAAAATAALQYRERILMIADLVPTPDPNLLDLCVAHASRMTAPYGWRRIDSRATSLPAGQAAG